MSFVMFWSSECLLMGVICFLLLPRSLPASPRPNSPLFACCSSCSTPPSTTAMSSPCVLRHYAQHWTCSSWLVSLFSLYVCFVMCIPAMQHVYVYCCTDISAAGSSAWNGPTVWLLSIVYWSRCLFTAHTTLSHNSQATVHFILIP